jgi:hypothetical protein
MRAYIMNQVQNNPVVTEAQCDAYALEALARKLETTPVRYYTTTHTTTQEQNR